MDVCVVYSAAEIRPLCVFHCYINQDVKKGGKCLTFTVRTSRGNTRVKHTCGLSHKHIITYTHTHTHIIRNSHTHAHSDADV